MTLLDAISGIKDFVPLSAEFVSLSEECGCEELECVARERRSEDFALKERMRRSQNTGCSTYLTSMVLALLCNNALAEELSKERARLPRLLIQGRVEDVRNDAGIE